MTAAARTAVLVFDVNETLPDIDALSPYFTSIFGDAAVRRQWFDQLVMYSMTVTLSDCYVDFFALGQAVLRMIAEVHGIALRDGDVAALSEAMATMPAHPDGAQGLSRLRDDGYRLAALTNSPSCPGRPTPLESAGLAGHFERQFTVDQLRVFKPSATLYRHTAHELGVWPEECMMVAAHAWDTIGAQGAGFGGALITRPGNAPLRADGVPRPNLVASDLVDLSRQLTSTFEN